MAKVSRFAINSGRHYKERPITIMNVELNLEELEQIVEALNQKHDALSSGCTEVLPELQAVNRLLTD